jgi:hypothetical protein
MRKNYYPCLAVPRSLYNFDNGALFGTKTCYICLSLNLWVVCILLSDLSLHRTNFTYHCAYSSIRNARITFLNGRRHPNKEHLYQRDIVKQSR